MELSSEQELLFVGTYTTEIYTYRFNSSSGVLSPVSTTRGLANPSFLAVHPNRRTLYAVLEGVEGRVSALAIDPETGTLALLGEQPSGGSAPCYVSVDGTGRFLFVANYGSGSLAVLPIAPDGRLNPLSAWVQHQGSSGVDPQRQEGPHAHCALPDPAGRHVLSADLGLDRVMVYRFDPAQGTLTPGPEPWAEVAPGAGPRHLAFHPSGRWAYVTDELNSTLTAFHYDSARGHLQPVQALSLLPAGWQGVNYPAHVVVSPSGRFVYASNRGHDSIAILAVHPETGRLSAVGHQSTRGNWPRHFTIDPSGAWLLAANQNSDSVAVFRIDADTGELAPVGDVTAVPSPACLCFLQG